MTCRTAVTVYPTFRHCAEEIPPNVGLYRKRSHAFLTSFKRQNDVTPSNAMTDVIFAVATDVS